MRVQISHQDGCSLGVSWSPANGAGWTFVYRGKPKPFFHPVTTPEGTGLTLSEPADHVWHRGHWFTIKYVNGENFWEETAPFGTQRVLGDPTVTELDGDRVRSDLAIEWIGPTSQEPVIRETRSIVSWVDGDALVFDWVFSLVPSIDVVLDRTPFTTWGGYSGISFRGRPDWTISRALFPDGVEERVPPGKRAAWCDVSGTVGDSGASTGVTMLDHPENPRHPTPWYGGGSNSGNFLNAAFLFAEPVSLGQGEELRLRYRVLVHDGIWERAAIERHAAMFGESR